MKQRLSKRSKLLWALLLGLVWIGAAACADGGATEPVSAPLLEPTETAVATVAPDVLQIMYWQAPSLLNPHLSASTKDTDLSRIVYEPLASFDSEANLTPVLAAEIPTLENGLLEGDGRSVTWKLKEDVRWADGEPFTADDVLFTYEFITNPEVSSSSRGTYSSVESVEVLDSYTIRVTFTDVTPAWFVPFVGKQGVILPQHIFEAYNGVNAREAPENETPIGTGPYFVTEFKPQEVLFLGDTLVQTNRLIFEPNPYFRVEGKPAFDRIVLEGGGSSDEAARLVLQTEEADFAWSLTPSQDLNQLAETAEHGELVVSFGSRVQRLALNRTDPNTEAAGGERSSLQFEHPFLSDPNVRMAINYAIDRESIAELYGVAGRPTSNNLVVPEEYSSPNTTFEFNLDKASALLTTAGWVDRDRDGFREKNGVRLKLVYNAPINKLVQQTQKIIKEDLELIGIEVELQPVEASVFYSPLPDPDPRSGRKFYADMQEFFVGMVSPDPGGYMRYWTCSQIPQQENSWSGLNLERWCSDAYDALYEQTLSELDGETRQALFIEMNDRLIDDVVMIPLVHLGEVSAVGNDIEGISPTPWDSVFWNIQDWRRE